MTAQVAGETPGPNQRPLRNVALVGLGAFVSVFCLAPALAQQAVPAEQIGSAPELEELEVVGERDATPKAVGQATGELSGDELRMKLSGTLGETIANEPGVHNASFGPGVGLPVLRGLSGIRVRASEGGIGAWDASAISPDHASTIEAVLADRIEIVRGPATLRNGSGAIGGVVNVITNRIHETPFEESALGSFETRYETINHNQRTAAGKLDLRLSNFVFHVDGFARDQSNVQIPGVAIDEAAVAEQFFFDAGQDNTTGFISNTDARSTGGAGGLSYVTDNGYVGMAVSQLDNAYGIPPGAHTEPDDAHDHGGPTGDAIEAAPDIRIDLEQTRVDLRAGLALDRGPLQGVALQVGDIDYEHFEAEGTFVGTLFQSDTTEGRLTLEHKPLLENHSGEVGVHYVDRYFAAVGLESFVPPSNTESVGVFVIERYDAARWSIEAGLRAENVRLEQLEPTAALRPTLTQFMHDPIEYNLQSASIGAQWALTDANSLSLLVGRSARAPEVQELMSLGPHLATRSYSIGALIRGDDGLQPETFDTLDVGWEHTGRFGAVKVEAFYTAANDFVYQANTGVFFDLAEEFFRFNCARIEECMPVYEYTQADATMHGVEWQWQLPRVSLSNADVGVELFGDFVRGRLDHGEDLPRMPPMRVGVGLDWAGQRWSGDLRATHVAAQDRPGLNETGTGSYMNVAGSLSYTMTGKRFGNYLFFIRGKNLMDEEIRNAASFLRSFAPEPGRSVELGLRFDY
ncbi:MAG: TonB-dependent receptor [Gammaproteobacteria bacterium]